jgi:hypothetical protein
MNLGVLQAYVRAWRTHYSTLVNGDRSEVDELPGDCLLTEVGEQTTSVNETVDGNRERWGGHRSKVCPQGYMASSEHT